MSAFRKKQAPDFDRNFLAQYEDLDFDNDEDVEAVVEEEEEQGVNVAGEDENKDDGVTGVSRKRPKMTASVVVDKLDVFLGPKFRSLSEIKDPEQWLSKLMRLYENWADSVAPVSMEVFFKRLEKWSSQPIVKNALYDLQCKRARMADAEDDEAEREEKDIEAQPQFPELEEYDLVESTNNRNDNNNNINNNNNTINDVENNVEDSDELVLIFDQ
jgi:hypothetical protein